MLLQLLQRHHLQCLGVRSFQVYRRCNACEHCLFPAQGAQAPAVARLKSSKAHMGARCHQVIAPLQRIRQEGRRYTRAHHVRAVVIGISLATTVPQVAGQWIKRAGQQGATQHVQCSHICLPIFAASGACAVIQMDHGFMLPQPVLPGLAWGHAASTGVDTQPVKNTGIAAVYSQESGSISMGVA